ncbi:LysR family transcriptional regulator [Nocardia yunnanensis]|uniref:LysR family transcriptional regulator n=1 Tax=Nocardia yunnanensis TaxID=2382165 RepID=A0A386ZAD2_9NOCA|nr:LysR family transcriptional regulator [Nocardia yunnanensis]AYF74792.1 LysR family transcriptional regulator [Nocardia yunnanensis]
MDPRDIELRDIEIFLTLSTELHFGRTAERLYLSQARVSQVIRKLENQVGGKLFERSSRAVTLTAIGRRLYEDLHTNYHDLRASLDRAARSARYGEHGLLRVGVTSSSLEEIRPLLKMFQGRYPNCGVHIEHVHFGNPFGALRADDIDVLVSWLPIEEPDLVVGPVLYEEPFLLLVAADHPLATRQSASYEDLADYGVFGAGTAQQAPEYWQAAAVPFTSPSGRAIVRTAHADTFQDMIMLVASGKAITPVHAHAAVHYSRPDVAYVPMPDAPPARWALLWRRGADNSLIRDLAALAATLPTAPAPVRTPDKSGL